MAEPKNIAVKWTGPTRYFPDLRQTVKAGDTIEIPEDQLSEYTEPIQAPESAKPKASAKPKPTEET